MIRVKVKELFRIVWMPLVMVAAMYCMLIAVGNLEQGQEKESVKQIEHTIHRAVLTCYSIEGVYPATLEYVEEHYGLQIDHEKYAVFYEIFADNIMPEITVVKLK